ncbi:Por secretion system C-terminal sorting domain-containing protein [Lutibacter agarilyticus]|uniref:Por secretion system C-terminal sorting domain-containing protein n=1 Tax=Lutibacter agarilyticus TaxID=1109740 RepID=A0A238XAR6_9FLAO|nr:T9SS type A sorting domain-containing protein [Lutibacter agarilyticus]SNR54959.1 Por secretion system C-terminal sorting domain-containing protein [Lutibacter agarilyticus]
MKQNYFILVCLFLICRTSLFSQIVNEGIIQIKSGTEVYFGEEYTNKSGANHNNDGDLYLNHNFNNNGITSAVSGTTFFKSTTNAIQTISGSTKEINFFNLEVDNSTTGVLVEDNFGLFVTNTLTLTSGDLRLVDEAQLIQVNNVANSGSGNLLRDQQGISTIYGFNYWSSPVHIDGVFKLSTGLFDGTDAASNPFSTPSINYATALDGAATSPITISTRWLYTYAPNSAGYSGWIKRDHNSEIAIATGYSIKGTGAANQNYIFKGTPNNGTYTFTVNNGESVLLGNPYPSALDITKFIEDNDDTGIVNQIYFWVDGGSDSHVLANYKGGYATRNITAGVAPTLIPGTSGLGDAAGKIPGQYLAVGQGFFVDATASGTITFNNAQRDFVTEAGDSEFLKSAQKASIAETGTDLSKNSIIRIGYRDPKGYHRQIVLGFVPNSPADINFNPGYDALMADPRINELFFIIENDLTRKYVIEGVGSYDDSIEIPLGLLMAEEGQHTIMLDAVENFAETVYIKDNLLNTTHSLCDASFNLNISTGNYLDRFSIVFKPSTNQTLAVDDENIADEKIVAFYDKNNSIIVKNTGSKEIKNITIFNLLGQQIVKVNKNSYTNAEVSIPFYFKEGVYVIVVDTNLGRETFKIVN